MNKHIFKTAKVLNSFLTLFVHLFVLLTIFVIGYVQGFNKGVNEAAKVYENKSYVDNVVSSATNIPSVPAKNLTKTQPQKISWGGPQLWEAVNKRRVELGVNPMSVKEEVCTLASIRLNQLLDLGKLDGHAGFSSMPTDRPDLKWIFEKYDLSEFLVSGADTPSEAVSLWENTLGHKELMSGGQYVWGCIYAQNGYGVAITAY